MFAFTYTKANINVKRFCAICKSCYRSCGIKIITCFTQM